MFVESWLRFVQAIATILGASVQANLGALWGVAFRLMINAALQDFLNNRVASAIREASTPESDDENAILAHLSREMDVVVQYVNNSNLSNPDQLKSAADAANEALGSIEKLLARLPRWLRHLVEIIREMLGFAKIFAGAGG